MVLSPIWTSSCSKSIVRSWNLNRLDTGGRRGLAIDAEPEPLPAAKQPLHAGDENRQLEGFRQIVVGARLKSLKNILRAAAGGEHQDRDELPGAPQLGHDREPGHAWQHDIEDDQVEASGIGQQLRQRRFSRVHHLGVVMLGDQVELQTCGDMLLVFDDQDPAHRGGDNGS